MFSLLNGVYDSYLAPTELNILVVGASSVGKTTLLERIKVTQMSKRSNQAEALPIPLTAALHEAFAKGGSEIQMERTTTTPSARGRDSSVTNTAPSQSPAPVVVQNRRFKLSICPAPSRYSKTAQDQEEDFIVDDEAAKSQDTSMDDTSKSIEEEMLTLKNQVCPDAPRRFRCHSKEFNVENLDILDGDSGGERRLTSMESIPLDDAQELRSPKLPANKQECSSSLLQENFEEFHLKPKAKMLPLSKIRPTIGSNLAKIDMYGAKCRFFDVGGKLQDLWERYYDDCDAVIFCWRLGDDPEAPSTRDQEEAEAEEPVDFSKQQEILNQVRKAISDDVPFLIFGHVFGNVDVDLVDKMYSTYVVFPHYHNNLTGLYCGSAKTGAGIPQALEWLIPRAKRQQKERVAARRKLEGEEKEV